MAGTPTITVDWAAVGAAVDQSLTTLGEFAQQAPTYPSGANIAVVEVDPATGEVELVCMVAVDDAGVVISPMLAEGQVHGGLGAGIAQALFEQIVYDDHGNLVTSNFADYAIPSAAELPMFETALLHLGVRIIDMPLAPHTVWQAIADA